MGLGNEATKLIQLSLDAGSINVNCTPTIQVFKYNGSSSEGHPFMGDVQYLIPAGNIFVDLFLTFSAKKKKSKKKAPTVAYSK